MSRLVLRVKEAVGPETSEQHRRLKEKKEDSWLPLKGNRVKFSNIGLTNFI